MQKEFRLLTNSCCIAAFAMISWIVSGCHAARKVETIQNAIGKKDTTSKLIVDQAKIDSMKSIQETVDGLRDNYIDFHTFSAKIKVEYEDSHGKQPNTTAYVRIVKDSMIWVSLYATVFNIEAFRILITKDSVFVVDKINKEVQQRSLSYLEDVTGIPFDYTTLQDVIIGNPIYLDTNIVSYKKTDTKILVSTVGKYFKHLLTLSNDSSLLLLHSKLDDVDVNRNRTADLTYDDYDDKSGFDFSTFREITVSEKNKLDITLYYKQYDFNKDLSISFSVPKNYKQK
jgi:hypothetical protein